MTLSERNLCAAHISAESTSTERRKRMVGTESVNSGTAVKRSSESPQNTVSDKSHPQTAESATAGACFFAPVISLSSLSFFIICSFVSGS